MPLPTPLPRSHPFVKKVLAATFPEYRGRKVRAVAYTGPRRWTVCWDEGSRDSVKLLTLDGRTGTLRAGAPWQNPEGVLALVDQPEGSILVVHSIAAGTDAGITMIVRRPAHGTLGFAAAALLPSTSEMA